MVFLPNQIIFSFQQENITFFLPEQKQTIFSWDVTDKLFFQDMFIEPYNCETGMHGTVTCRPTVAHRVQVDGIIVSKNEMKWIGL